MKAQLHFLAEKGFYSLTPEQKALICNGAGAANDWRSFLIPNTLWGLDCTKVFDIHDHAYHVGFTRMDKLRADVNMLVNLIISIIVEGGWFFTARVFRAATYFVAVHLKGDDAFFTTKKGNKHLNRRSEWKIK